MKKKGILSLLLAVTLTNGTVAFGYDSNTVSSKDNSQTKTETRDKNTETEKGQYINITLSTDPITLDPSRTSDSYSGQVLTHIFDGLTRIEQDENGKDKIVPGIAETWDVSEDGKTYIFHLRDAKWADGQPIVAGDFEYGIKRTLDPNTGSSYAWIITDVIKGAKDFNSGKADASTVGVTAIDDKTLKIELESPVAYFLDLSYFRVMFPQRKDIVEKYGDAFGFEGENIMSNGAFTIKEWKHNFRIVLEKNPNYWDAQNVKLEKVTMYIVKDLGNSMNMLYNGSIDVGNVSNKKWKEALNETEAFNSSSYDKPSAVYEIFNQENKYFKNAKIRKAFIVALDREEINETLYNGSFTPAKAWCPPAIQIEGEYYREKAGAATDWITKLQEENPDPQALLIEGLKELGESENPGDMTVTMIQSGTTSISRDFAEFEKQRLEEVLGIKVNVDYYDWSIFNYKIYNGEYEFASQGWVGDYNDPMTFFEMFLSTSQFAPKGWKNEKYDELIKKASQTADNEKRFNYFKEAEKILLYEDGAISPWTYRQTSLYTRKYVKNVFTPSFGSIDVTRAYTVDRYGYYAKGCLYFDNQKYEKALVEFDKYLETKKNDRDAVMYKIICYLYLGQKDIAFKYANNLINEDKNAFLGYEAKGFIFELTSDYDEVVDFYKETAKKIPDNLDAQIYLGRIYYEYGKYNNSLNHFIKLIETNTDNLDLITWVIYNYSELGEYDKALEYCNKALEIDDKSSQIFNAIGNVYVDKLSYMESIKYYDKALQLDPFYEDAYVNKLYALYNGKRYSKCVEFGKEIEPKFKLSVDIPWYIANSYLELGKIQESLVEYKKCIELDPDNDTILSYIAYNYLLLQDYEKASLYIDETLKLNSENTTALYLKETLQNKQIPLGKQVKEFFRDNYLYNDNSNALEAKLSKYFSEDDMSNNEITEAIEKVKLPDDLFTYVISGEEYDYSLKREEYDVKYENYDEDICYLRINNFSSNTDNKVIEILDNIKDTENKSLIIDLRDNYGGDTKSANNILDALLPECVTSTLIYKDGTTRSFYSDASQIPFENIYIFVNENSASASELLTLGLKTYLDNVSVIGRNTYGKGVGQDVFEDKERKIMIAVVSHYWNVRQTNIMDTHISPDIYVDGNNLEDFIREIKSSDE